MRRQLERCATRGAVFALVGTALVVTHGVGALGCGVPCAHKSQPAATSLSSGVVVQIVDLHDFGLATCLDRPVEIYVVPNEPNTGWIFDEVAAYLSARALGAEGVVVRDGRREFPLEEGNFLVCGGFTVGSCAAVSVGPESPLFTVYVEPYMNGVARMAGVEHGTGRDVRRHAWMMHARSFEACMAYEQERAACEDALDDRDPLAFYGSPTFNAARTCVATAHAGRNPCDQEANADLQECLGEGSCDVDAGVWEAEGCTDPGCGDLLLYF